MLSDVLSEQPRVQGKQNFILTDITVPRFCNSADQNPLRFIKDLEAFFELRGVPRYAKLSVVKQSLYANCIGWFEMHVSDDTSYDEFKDHFLGHYWDQSRQSEIRYQIMNGKYDSRKHGTMAEYFIVMGQQARFLDPVVPMGEFIGLMANHYPLDVRSVMIVSKPQGPQEAIKLLKELQPLTKSSFPNFDNRPRENNAPIKKSELAQIFFKEWAGPDNRSNQTMGSRPYAGPPSKNNYHPPRNNYYNPLGTTIPIPRGIHELIS